jgi:hypothetical protein
MSKSAPAVAPKKSVFPDRLICIDCGAEMKLADPAPFVPLTSFSKTRRKQTDYGAKAVLLGGRRYIVCINHQEAAKDATDRALLVADLERCGAPWTCRAASFLELGAQALPSEQEQIGLAPVGAIRPDGSGRVVAVESMAELRAIMGSGMGDCVAPDEAMLAVDADMGLVAKRRHRDLRCRPALGPAGQRVALAAPLDGPAALAVDLLIGKGLDLITASRHRRCFNIVAMASRRSRSAP